MTMAMTAVVKAVTATTAVLPESPVTVVVICAVETVGAAIVAAPVILLAAAAVAIAVARVEGFATAAAEFAAAVVVA